MERIRIPVDALQIGMYVDELDRPWLESPFLFQGFPIRNEEELEQLQSCCQYVYVDQEKSLTAQLELPRLSVPTVHRFSTRKVNIARHNSEPPVVNSVPFSAESKKASAIHKDAHNYINTIFQDIRLGHSLDTMEAQELTDRMVDSIIRNENALLWLTQLKNKDEYTTMHSINVCVLSLLFGHYLGLNKQDLRQLGFGALLHDVGKVQIPDIILNKPETPTPEEMQLLQQHPAFSKAILESSTGEVPPAAIEIAYAHHERFDGSGYPRGLSGKAIHPLAMIVSIVDVYDAITSNRVYHIGIAPHEALNMMYQWSSKSFPKSLVEKFIRCLGIYPVGSIVELNNGSVGVVMTVNRDHHLYPLLTLVLDHHKRPLSCPVMLDLQFQENEAKPLLIKHILASGAHGIDVRRIIQQNMGAAPLASEGITGLKASTASDPTPT